MTGLDAPGQAILRAYVWWEVVAVLLEPTKAGSAHARASQHGASHYVVPGLPGPGSGGGWCMTTTSRGVELGVSFRYRDDAPDPAHLVTWTAVAEHARNLTRSQRSGLADAFQARQHHAHRTYPHSHHHTTVRGCGRPPHANGLEGPATPEQAKYADELHAWERDVLVPWQDRLAALEAEVRAALDGCLPLAALLAAGEPVETIGQLDLLQALGGAA